MPLAVWIKAEFALIVKTHVCQEPSLVSTFNKTLSLLTIAFAFMYFLDINLEHFLV